MSSFSPNPFYFQQDAYLLPDEFNEEFRVNLSQYFNNLAISLNAKETALFLEDEIPTGGLFIPTFGTTKSQNVNFRPIFRTVVDTGALPNATTKSVAHGITTTQDYSFIRIYGGATDPGATTITSVIPLPFASPTLNENIKVDIDATNVNITTGINRTAFTRSYVILEYIKEI